MGTLDLNGRTEIDSKQALISGNVNLHLNVTTEIETRGRYGVFMLISYCDICFFPLNNSVLNVDNIRIFLITMQLLDSVASNSSGEISRCFCQFHITLYL